MNSHAQIAFPHLFGRLKAKTLRIYMNVLSVETPAPVSNIRRVSRKAM